MSERHLWSRGPAFFLSALLVPAFIMAGCETPPPDEDPDMTPDWTEQEAETDTTEFSADFSEVGESGISGEATVMRPEQNGVTMIVIELDDLPEEGEYSASLHQGTCEEMGAEVAELNAVRGLADRTGQSQTTLQTGDIPIQQDLSIQVHREQQQAVACADIDRDEWDLDRDRTPGTTDTQTPPDYQS